jgi:hypothetical protein
MGLGGWAWPGSFHPPGADRSIKKGASKPYLDPVGIHLLVKKYRINAVVKAISRRGMDRSVKSIELSDAAICERIDDESGVFDTRCAKSARANPAQRM